MTNLALETAAKNYGTQVAKALLTRGRIERHLDEWQIRDLVAGSFLKGIEYGRELERLERPTPKLTEGA